MKPLARDLIKFLFESDYDNFSNDSFKEVTHTFEKEESDSGKVIITGIKSMYWFEYEKEYVYEMEEWPIELECLAMVDVGEDIAANREGPAWISIDLKTGELKDGIDIIDEEFE